MWRRPNASDLRSCGGEMCLKWFMDVLNDSLWRFITVVTIMPMYFVLDLKDESRALCVDA